MTAVKQKMSPNSSCRISAVNMDYPNDVMYKVLFSMFAYPRFAFLLYFLCHFETAFYFFNKVIPKPWVHFASFFSHTGLVTQTVQLLLLSLLGSHLQRAPGLFHGRTNSYMQGREYSYRKEQINYRTKQRTRMVTTNQEVWNHLK